MNENSKNEIDKTKVSKNTRWWFEIFKTPDDKKTRRWR